MVFENTTAYINDLIGNLSLSNASNALQPLIVFVIAMAVYSIFVFKFYKFISQKDIFRLSKGGDHTTLKKIAYTLEYIFLFPIIAFFWFLVISIILTMISEVIALDNIFMLSMATLATIRITAYFSEELSRDIAKLIPFALLVIAMIDTAYISPHALNKVINQIPAVVDILIYYFIFILILESVLKLIFHGKPKISPRKADLEEDIEKEEYVDIEKI